MSSVCRVRPSVSLLVTFLSSEVSRIFHRDFLVQSIQYILYFMLSVTEKLLEYTNSYYGFSYLHLLIGFPAYPCNISFHQQSCLKNNTLRTKRGNIIFVHSTERLMLFFPQYAEYFLILL